MLGLTNTMRGVQKRRAPLYAHKDSIAAMRIPTLVVLGGDDQGCDKPSHFLAETLPGARLEILPHTGHGVNIEEPERVNRMVADFIDGVEAGALVALRFGDRHGVFVPPRPRSRICWFSI